MHTYTHKEQKTKMSLMFKNFPGRYWIPSSNSFHNNLGEHQKLQHRTCWVQITHLKIKCYLNGMFSEIISEIKAKMSKCFLTNANLFFIYNDYLIKKDLVPNENRALQWKFASEISWRIHGPCASLIHISERKVKWFISFFKIVFNKPSSDTVTPFCSLLVV